MNKLLKNFSLEKRIFLIFFIVTIVFVLILTGIEWQITAYLIKQYEDGRIGKRLDKIRLSQLEYKKKGFETIENLLSEKKLKSALKENDTKKIKDIFKKYRFKTKNKYLALFNLDKERIAGESWGLLEKYLPLIFDNIVEKASGLFFVGQNNKDYVIRYSPLFSDIERSNLYGFVVSSELLKFKRVLNSNFNYNYLAAPINENSLSKLSLSPEETKRFKKKIENLFAQKKAEGIMRISSEIAYGLLIEYDLKGKVALVVFTRYDRNFNSFAQKSGFLFLLIIFSLAIVMLSLLANWFGKRIIDPIKEVSDEMHRIASNPETVGKISGDYKGELETMVETFNNMNRSLAKYKESLLQYKLATENLEAGVFWLDKKFRISFSNPSFKQILNLENGEAIRGRFLTDFIELPQESLKRCKEEKVVILNKELSFEHEKRFVVIIINPVQKIKETTMVGSISDVTNKIKERRARLELELELIKLNKLASIGKRVQGIIHNINSPLNSILGYAQLIKKHSERSEDVERIINASKKIASYIKILQSKMRNEEISTTHPVDINELIIQEMEFCKHNLFYKHQVNTYADLDENLPSIKAVYGDISSCFTNLFNNAIDSLKNSDVKKVWVKTYKKDGFIGIEIKDSGCGIEQNNLKKIFNPDFTTKEDEAGTGLGLGLAICKRIANKYEGYIEVESEINVGSTFTFFIPIQIKE